MCVCVCACMVCVYPWTRTQHEVTILMWILYLQAGQESAQSCQHQPMAMCLSLEPPLALLLGTAVVWAII